MAISFSTTSGSTTATVHDPEHGVELSDRVVFDTVSGLDGTTEDLLTGEFVIQTIPSVNSYTITLAANAGTTYSEQGQAQAFYLLEKGFAKESDFEKLPEGIKPVPEEKVKEDFQRRHAPKKRVKNEASK